MRRRLIPSMPCAESLALPQRVSGLAVEGAEMLTFDELEASVCEREQQRRNLRVGVR